MIQRPQLTKAAVNLLGRSIGTALVRGALQLYGGRWGGESILLAEFVFPDAFDVDESAGLVRFSKFEMTKAKAMGDIAWYRAKAKNPNASLIEGSVGTENANMLVTKTRVYAGMELTLPSFEYAFTLPLRIAPVRATVMETRPIE